jgi:hypothetical protein
MNAQDLMQFIDQRRQEGMFVNSQRSLGLHLVNPFRLDEAALEDYPDAATNGSFEDPEHRNSDYGKDTPFNVSKGLITGCHVCNKKTGLSRCGACKVVQYCGREHQASDRPIHKRFCNAIKKAQAKYDEEEADLRSNPGNGFDMPANVFDDCAGHFWGILGTRDYMRARYAVVEALLKINTKQAVQTALDHLLDMLRLCRSDNMGVRDSVPSLYLRLGRDQEAYDFCKWWTTCDPDGEYDWGDMSLPYLNLHGEDVFESVDWLPKDYPTLSYTVAVTLIKIRLLKDLRTLERIKREAGPHVPQEILDYIRSQAVSSIIAQNRTILERDDQSAQIRELEKQIKTLFDTVKKANRWFWPAMLKPERELTSRPNYYSSGNESEMVLRLQECYNAWIETPGAIGVIEELSKRK